MSHPMERGKGLTVILLPPGDGDASELGSAEFRLSEFNWPWELLRCSWNSSSATSLAEEKNQVWRCALGQWVLFMAEGSKVPPLEPFAGASELDLIYSGSALVPSGAPDLGPPFAIRRTFLAELNGFSDLPGGVEDFELGLRLHEAGARTLNPAGWPRSMAVSPGVMDFETVLALFYRHPYFWVLDWACDRLETPLPNSNEDLPARFARIFGRPVPAQCRHSAEELGHYFAERADPAFQPHQVITRALEGAEDAGLFVSGPKGDRRFERSHAANWLIANTGYFEAMTARNLVLRIPPPRLAEGPSAPPLAIDLEGRYEVEVGADVARGLMNPILSLPLPVACDEQRDLHLFDFEPPEFERFMDEARTSVHIPLTASSGGTLRMGYSFRCRVREGMGGPAGPAPPAQCTRVSARHGAMLDAIIATIFRGGASTRDPRQRAGRVYAWILDHIAFRESLSVGLFALEARAGNCAHRVRLFTLLCERAGLTVRERCGFLAGDLQGEGTLNGQRWACTARSDRGHSLFHVWAEVFLGEAGWSPVDFLGTDCGRRMTPGNVCDAAMRERLKNWMPRLEDYYFGNVDPYRVYLDATPKSLSGIPSGIVGEDLDRIWRVAWGTRHTLRTRLLGLPPGPCEVGG